MSATPAPLVWDFSRTVGPVDSVGGNVHYYDTAAQRIYLKNGIATRVTEVEEGHWETAAYGAEILVDNTPYTLLTVDHPHNGILFMTATDGEALYFLRYVYAMEISSIITAGSWRELGDSRVAQIALTCENIGAATFSDHSTLFNPGAKLTLAFTVGDSAAYDVGVAYVDDVDFDAYSPTVPLSGSNSIGFKLRNQTMDELVEITGFAHEVAAAILEHAGITKYKIEPGTHEWTHTFKPEQACLAAMVQLAQFYSPEAMPWDFAELADGTVVAGYPSWIRQHRQNSVYEFNAGNEVLKRATGKNADGAFVRVRVTGKDADGVDLEPVYADVPHFGFWALGAHKTKHVAAPDGFTQEQLEDYAQALAGALQYVGIGEQFAGLLRPHLLCGDVASAHYTGDAESVDLGLINDLEHVFGEGGYWTLFSVDSGGVATEGANYVITRAAALNGFNRRQTLADLIGVIAKG